MQDRVPAWTGRLDRADRHPEPIPTRLLEARMSQRTPLIALALCLSLSWDVATHGQGPPTRDDGRGRGAPDSDPVATTHRILAEIDAKSELMANLEYLCDRIGPRLTGSEKLKTASEWTRAKFEGYGLERARLEPWSIARAWTRGNAS